MKIIRDEEWDTKLKFPWAFVEYRIECQQGTWALFGIHWFVLAWRRRWLPLYWLKKAYVWHVEPGTYLRYGHFCHPWSGCRKKEQRKNNR